MLEFVGLCIIAVVGWFFWQKKSSHRGGILKSGSDRQEPTITDIVSGPIIKRTAPDQVELNLDPLNIPLWVETEGVDASKITDDEYENIEAELDTALDALQTETTTVEEAREEPIPAPERESKVVAFAVMSQVGKIFSGKEILSLFSDLDLTFSEGSGFYIKPGVSNVDNPLFTIANMVTPGNFDPTIFISQSTPGLLLFTRLEVNAGAWKQFEAIVETAETLTERLDGVLCDEQHKAISGERMVEIQNDIAAVVATYSRDS